MKIKFKNQLKGARLVLKNTKPTIKMAESMFLLIDANRAHLEPRLPWVAKSQCTEDLMKYLLDKEEKTKQGKKIEYGIYVKGQYIGNISIFDVNTHHKSAEIGYWLSASSGRNGYMTEAVGILEKEAFENLKLNRLQITCDENNLASSGVAKKCEYQFEGTLRQESYSEYFQSYTNKMYFSKLKSDFIK